MKLIDGIEFYPLKGYDKYLISKTGLVYSLYKNRIMNEHDNSGYKMLWLTNSDGSRWQYIHRLVCEQWIQKPEIKSEIWVNHKDGNKSNNNISNLEWSTISENITHAFKTGLHKIVSGADHWKTGTKVSAEVKKIMSEKKTGINHPKFKGYYITPFGTFPSANIANKQTGINQKKIIALCKLNANGWQFEPVIRD